MFINGLSWTPADHKHFPPAFESAARTLLLAHHRLRHGGITAGATASSAGASVGTTAEQQAQQAQQGFAQVPAEVVLGVIKQAAFPLGPWLAADHSKSDWLALEFHRRLDFASLFPAEPE